MASVETIETEKYLMRIDAASAYMEYVIKPGVTMDIEDIVAAKAKVLALYGNLKFYVYSEGAEFFTLTKAAREMCASTDHLDNTIAIAFYTSNVSLFLLGDLYNKVNKPHVPTEFFMNRDNAREWLREQAKNNNHPCGF